MKLSSMMQMGMMALQYMKGRKLRTTLTTLAIVFGVAMIFAFNLILPSVYDAFERSMTIGGEQADLAVTNVTREGFSPDAVMNIVAQVEGVENVTALLRRRVLLPVEGNHPVLGSASFVDITGVDPLHDARDVREGRFLQAEDIGMIVISPDINLAPGETLTLPLGTGLQTYTVVGVLQTETNQPHILMTLPEAQTVFNQPGLVNVIEASLADGADKEQVVQRVEKALGSGYEVNSELANMLAVADVGYAIINLLGAIALFLGGFLIFNTFRTVIIERRHDLAMLRAIGATRRQLTQMILIESLLQGLAGTIIGLILGYLLALAMQSWLRGLVDEFMSGVEIEMSLTGTGIGMAVGMGLLTTFFAGYLPARKAGHISPIAALRPVTASEANRAARWGLTVGGVLLVLAVLLLIGSDKTTVLGAVLFLVGMVVASPSLVVPMARLFQPMLTVWFSRESELAQHNMTRQPGRAAITASTLMIGLATLVLIAAVVNGFGVMLDNFFDSNFSSDVMLMPPQVSNYSTVAGADAQLANALRDLPEVETVNTIRYASSAHDGARIEILGINAATFVETSPLVFNEGNPDEAYQALSDGRTMLVNSLVATAFGLEIGDEFALQTANGVQNYRVVGIGDDLFNFKLNTFYISQENMALDFGKTEDVMLMLNLQPGTDKTRAIEKIKQVASAYPQFQVEDTRVYREEMQSTTNNTLRLYWAIGILILIPAVLGLLNTLTINVLERTREIGIVRAIGGSRKQVQRMVTAEALLLGLFGAATGVLAGVAMSYGFTLAFGSIGWKVPYEIPYIGMGAVVVLAIVLALFASVLPARNAAKLDIIRALQYE